MEYNEKSGDSSRNKFLLKLIMHCLAQVTQKQQWMTTWFAKVATRIQSFSLSLSLSLFHFNGSSGGTLSSSTTTYHIVQSVL